jgi:hypothetical protein
MKCPCCNGTGEMPEFEPNSPHAIISIYYRRRARNAFPRKTLKQLAEEFNINYGLLRKCKMEYDAAGKWGSKKKS